MTGYPIPDAALANHIAMLGKTGSGKTSTTKLTIEHVVAQGFRVCVLDPIKSDWWGITSSADGKRPGLPFRILGGPRGHVPLHASAGKVIGQLVGQGKLPLSIVDMADFEPGGLQKFFNDFAPALLRHARGVVYLVVEEAHEFAPKERSGIGAETHAIHWAKKLATAGRSKGIRLIVATQRVQALHNAVLGSCETVIAHRLTTPADQEPVRKWLGANADKESKAMVEDTLASLPTGTGWLCSGEAQLFERIAFPKFATYDNTATPTADSEEVAVKTAPVDHDELRGLIGEAVKEAEANDPKLLRAEIADLKRRIGAAEKAGAPTWPDQREEAARLARDYEALSGEFAGAENKGYQHGTAAGISIGIARCRTAIDSLRVPDIVDQIPAPAGDTRPNAPAGSSRKPVPPSPPRSTRPTASSAGEASSPSGGGASLTGPQTHLLKGLAWWAEMGHAEPTRTMLAAKIGWKPGGSNLRGRLSELSTAGLIEYPTAGKVRLTPAGAAAAPAPDLATTLIDSIRSVLTGPQGLLFEVLLESGQTMARAELAEAVGWEPGGSNIRGRLSEMSSLELIEYPSRGEVRLQDWVTG